MMACWRLMLGGWIGNLCLMIAGVLSLVSGEPEPVADGCGGLVALGVNIW